MEPHIYKPLLYFATTKDIWDTAQKLYLKRQMPPISIHREKKSMNASKGLDVISYFNKLPSLGKKWISDEKLSGTILMMEYSNPDLEKLIEYTTSLLASTPGLMSFVVVYWARDLFPH